ncbi:MAG TPA: type II 3-dehydroquinate dehydratase [Spirochaetaceae bacterium]|nr:type II 3-dehydroquinate dehydratase [Spirochaetaceae bacterium]
MKRFLVVNGPNINMLGIREPDIYGCETYEDLLSMISDYARKNMIEVETYQSNHEGDLVDRIQKAYFDKIDGIVINPAAYTHTSVAILDALKATGIPAVEVHISDVSSREGFRQTSYVREYVAKTIMGKGLRGYIDALECLLSKEKGLS